MIRDNRAQLYVASTFIIIVMSAVTVLLLILFDNREEKLNLSKKGMLINYSNSQFVEINGSFPITDFLAKDLDMTNVDNGSYGFIDFSVANIGNVSNTFKVIVTKEYVENGINDEYIKLFLVDEFGNPYNGYDSVVSPSYKKLLSVDGKPDSKLLFYDRIPANEVKKFRLKVWVSDVYIDIRNEKKFKLKVSVYSV